MRNELWKATIALVRAMLAASIIAFPSTAIAEEYEDAASSYDRGDYATALRLFKPLADQGRAGAQYFLGFMYGTGQGVLKNESESLKWHRKAADQGEAQAQYNLGVMYAYGAGEPQDYVKAHSWFNLAASLYTASEAEKRAIAVKFRDNMPARMTSAQIAEAQKLARGWKPK